MPSAAVVGAVLERYDSLAIASTAKIYFDEAPLVGESEIDPPYVVLKDEGLAELEFDFEHHPQEGQDLTFEIFAASLEQAAAIALGIKYNGGAVGAGQGMDFAASLPLTGATFQVMERQPGERFWQERRRNREALPVFRGSIPYRVKTLRT